MIRLVRQLMRDTGQYLPHEACKHLSFGVPLVLLTLGLVWAGLR